MGPVVIIFIALVTCKVTDWLPTLPETHRFIAMFTRTRQLFLS